MARLPLLHFNWENNRAEPLIYNISKLIKFLGYNPYPTNSETLGGRIKAYRILHGLSHKKIGKLVGVDASTIGSWEKNEHVPKTKVLNRLKQLLSSGEAQHLD